MCKEKIGFYDEKLFLVKGTDEGVCTKCLCFFKNLYKDMVELENPEDFDVFLSSTISYIKSKGYSKEFIAYVSKYIVQEKSIAQLKAEESNMDKNQEKLNQLESANYSDYMLTTGYNFEGYKITKYKGIVSGEVLLGTGLFSEFSADISDIFGTESTLFSDKLENAKKISLKKLVGKSIEAGGNAIIGVDFDYISIGRNMIGVAANGTSVIIERVE